MNTRLTLLGFVALAGLAAAGCEQKAEEAPAVAAVAEAQGEVLEPKVADEMVAEDKLTSEAPIMAPVDGDKGADKSKGDKSKDEKSKEDKAEDAAPTDAAPAEAAAPSEDHSGHNMDHNMDHSMHEGH